MTGYKLESISFSRMSTFLSCQFKWKQEYIEQRVLIQAGYAQVVGKFVHAVFEQFYLLPPSERTESAMRSLAGTVFADFVATESDWPLLHLTEEQEKIFKHDSWKLMLRLWDLEDPTEVDVIGTEIPFRIEVDGLPMNGFIDRVERVGKTITIADYKTGRAPWRKYLPDKVPQLILYAKGLQETTGDSATRGKFLFLGGDKPKEEKVLITPTKVNLELARMTRVANDIRAAVASDSFKPNPSKLCGWCPHIDICPTGQKFVKGLIADNNMRMDAPALAMEWYTG